MNHVGRNIRTAAGAHLCSLEMLADGIGCSRSGLMANVAARDWTNPRASTLIALARMFGVTVDDLLNPDARKFMTALAIGYDRAEITKP